MATAAEYDAMYDALCAANKKNSIFGSRVLTRNNGVSSPHEKKNVTFTESTLDQSVLHTSTTGSPLSQSALVRRKSASKGGGSAAPPSRCTADTPGESATRRRSSHVPPTTDKQYAQYASHMNGDVYNSIMSQKQRANPYSNHALTPPSANPAPPSRPLEISACPRENQQQQHRLSTNGTRAAAPASRRESMLNGPAPFEVTPTYDTRPSSRRRSSSSKRPFSRKGSERSTTSVASLSSVEYNNYKGPARTNDKDFEYACGLNVPVNTNLQHSPKTKLIVAELASEKKTSPPVTAPSTTSPAPKEKSRELVLQPEMPSYSAHSEDIVDEYSIFDSPIGINNYHFPASSYGSYHS